jgi:hypothetical protein
MIRFVRFVRRLFPSSIQRLVGWVRTVVEPSSNSSQILVEQKFHESTSSTRSKPTQYGPAACNSSCIYRWDPVDLFPAFCFFLSPSISIGILHGRFRSKFVVGDFDRSSCAADEPTQAGLLSMASMRSLRSQ